MLKEKMTVGRRTQEKLSGLQIFLMKFANGKTFVGSTANLETRKVQLNKENTSDYKLEVVETLSDCNGLDALNAKKKWVAEFNDENSLNRNVGNNGTYGLSQSDRKMIYDYFIECGNRRQTIEEFNISYGTLYNIIYRVEPFEGGESLKLPYQRMKAVYNYFLDCRNIEETVLKFNISIPTFYRYFNLLESNGKTPADYTRSREKRTTASLAHKKEIYDYFRKCKDIEKTMSKFNISKITFWAYFREMEKDGLKPSDYVKLRTQKTVEKQKFKKEVYKYFLKTRSVEETISKFDISIPTFYNYFRELDTTGKKPADYVKEEKPENKKRFTEAQRKSVYDYFLECKNVEETMEKFNISAKNTFYKYFYEFEIGDKKPIDYIKERRIASKNA